MTQIIKVEPIRIDIPLEIDPRERYQYDPHYRAVVDQTYAIRDPGSIWECMNASDYHQALKGLPFLITRMDDDGVIRDYKFQNGALTLLRVQPSIEDGPDLLAVAVIVIALVLMCYGLYMTFFV